MRGISFQSSKGNDYFYDDASGFIFPKVSIPARYLVQEKRKCASAVTQEQVKEHLRHLGYKQLILEMTQACNLRCKYCCYSEHYANTRNHGKENMAYETAVKAIDLYMKGFSVTHQINPMRNPMITFYGGEPLIHFALIKKIVEYVESKYPDFHAEYNITTNATLLNSDIIDFFVDREFSVIISLDGDKEDHDRNRVRADGTGTFDTVFQHVMDFKQKYPDYRKLGISISMDYRTDLYKLNKFVNENDLFVLLCNMINDRETDYYERFTPEEKEHFFAQMRELHDSYFQMADNEGMILSQKNLLMALFAYEYIEFGCHPIECEQRLPFMPYTASCVPGEKIYVTIDGKIHICERMNGDFPIGTVDTGLDYRKIVHYIERMNQNSDQCARCNVSRLCGMCYSRATEQGVLNIPDQYCQDRYAGAVKLMKDYVDLMESQPNQLNNIVTSYYMDLKNRLGQIVD